MIKYAYTDEEIINAFQNDTPVCKCHALMDSDDVNDVYRCPACGYSVSQIKYSIYNSYNDIIKDYVVTYDDLYDEVPNLHEDCKDCDGPWPNCKTSCSLFDD